MDIQTQTRPISLTQEDLPLYCSGPAQADSWNGHPRVFLPVQPNQDITCPYCGTQYRFEGELPHHHY